MITITIRTHPHDAQRQAVEVSTVNWSTKTGYLPAELTPDAALESAHRLEIEFPDTEQKRIGF